MLELQAAIRFKTKRSRPVQPARCGVDSRGSFHAPYKQIRRDQRSHRTDLRSSRCGLDRTIRRTGTRNSGIRRGRPGVDGN